MLFNKELFQPYITSPRIKNYFSKPQKELPLVALLGQEKISFLHSGLFIPVWAIDFRFQRLDFRFLHTFTKKSNLRPLTSNL